MAVNAGPHGALSVPEGRLSVSWQNDEPSGMLVLGWTEHSGAAVTAPTRKGFALLIDRTIRAKPGACYETDYRPDGLHWQVRLAREGGDT